MEEKQAVLAEMMELSGRDELAEVAAALADGVRAPRDTKELVMSAIVQSNRLLEAINDGMRLESVPDQPEGSGEEKVQLVPPQPGPSVPCLRLATIAAPLMKHLTNIMQRHSSPSQPLCRVFYEVSGTFSMQSTEEELRRLRLEVAHYKGLAEGGGGGAPVGQPAASAPTTDSDLGSSPSSIASSFHVHLPFPADLVRRGGVDPGAAGGANADAGDAEGGSGECELRGDADGDAPRQDARQHLTLTLRQARPMPHVPPPSHLHDVRLRRGPVHSPQPRPRHALLQRQGGPGA